MDMGTAEKQAENGDGTQDFTTFHCDVYVDFQVVFILMKLKFL